MERVPRARDEGAAVALDHPGGAGELCDVRHSDGVERGRPETVQKRTVGFEAGVGEGAERERTWDEYGHDRGRCNEYGEHG